nr:phospholipase-like protein [Tanacetum cinerariifolium]
MEQHNGMCGSTQDGTSVDRVVGKICLKMNRMSVDDGDSVLDSQSDDEDGFLDSQTKDVIEEASMLPTMSSNSPQEGNTAASSSSAHPGNDKDVSRLDDNMEIDVPNAKDLVVVTPKVDDPMLRTIKPKDDFDEANVDSYDDDYMSLFNDKEKPAKSSVNDMELQQEPDIVDVKDGILEQQANADKGKTTVIQESVGVTVEEKPSLGRGLGTLKFKKKNYKRALRPNYVLRSAKIRKKKMAMSLKSPFGQQSDTTPVPTKRKTRLKQNRRHCAAFRFRGRSFWLRLSCLNIGKSGWLTDKHLDLWNDLMWSLRQPKADCAIEKALVETNEESIARETNSLSTHA